MSDPTIPTAYAETRARITDLVRDLAPARAAAPVPACPEWRVRDVLAHVIGVCDDILSGRMEGVTTARWTEAQVAARRSASITEMLAEWEDTGARVEAMAGDFGDGGRQLLADIATHEQDLRGALDAPGGRDTAAWRTGVDFVAGNFGLFLAAAGLPLELRTPDRSWAVGDPDGRSLTTTEFEVGRALTGRRSTGQIAAYDWSVEPGPYLPHFTWGPFVPRETDLVE